MPEKKNKTRKLGIFSHLVLMLNVVAVILLFTSYAASYVSPDKFWPLLFVGMAYPVFVVINLFFLIYWMFQRKALILLSLVSILVGWNHLKSTVKVYGKTEIPDNMRSLKVMSFNVRYFDRFRWINKENIQTRNDIFRLIKAEAPDIICFQEFYNDTTRYFRTVDSLSKKYGYKYYHTEYALVNRGYREFGTATFSKHPVVGRDIFRFTNNIHNFAIITDIVVKQDTFRVFNIHFESIRLSEEDRMFINELASQFGNQDFMVEKYKQITSKIRFAAEFRASQSREIKALIANSPYPVILCTDLNDTPSSYAYRQLTRNLNDAFVESGVGIGNTYIGFLPAFRIDYIMYDPFFQSRSYRKINQKLSDHYPIVATLIY